MGMAEVHTKRIAALHRAFHARVGEKDLLALTHDETGGDLIQLQWLNAGQWFKKRINGAFDGFGDGQTSFAEELHVAFAALDRETADKIQAVQLGATFWRVKLMDTPNSLAQFWRFLLAPMEYNEDAAV